MGGHNGNNGDAMEWSEECELYFIELLAERVKRDPNGASILKGADWMEFDELIFLKYALRYGQEKLKGKYHRLRSMHTKFGELISNTGVTWDSNSGRVFANDAIWDDYFKRDKIFKTFKKKGCKLYSLLDRIFNNSTATGAFHNASTCAPQTSEEEHRIEQDYMGGNEIGEGEDSNGCQTKRKGEGDLGSQPGKRRVKKSSMSNKFDAFIDAWSQSMIVKTEKEKATAERYKTQSSETTSAVSEKYSIEECMVVLDGIPNVFYDAVVRIENKFPIPNGDYFYVVDSGYPNLKEFLAPYRGERYHRRDFQSGGCIRGKQELFNYTHYYIRNVIERAFSVLKARFHLLKDIPNYPLRRQMLFPHACCALHNFIRMEDRADNLFTIYGQEFLEVPGEGFSKVQEGFTLDMTNNDEMLHVRESIANSLWNTYSGRSRRQA